MTQWQGKLRTFIRKIPIVGTISLAQWPQLREALKELLVVLLFSLMPLWLGLFTVALLTLPDQAPSFLQRFASGADLGLISASLLGPLLYVILREQGPFSADKITAQFPSAYWFVLFIFLCCLAAAVVYNVTYLAGLHLFFDQHGHTIQLVNNKFVTSVSIFVFIVAILLVLTVAIIRNMIGSGTPGIMNEGASSLATDLQREIESEAADLTTQLNKSAKEE